MYFKIPNNWSEIKLQNDKSIKNWSMIKTTVTMHDSTRITSAVAHFLFLQKYWCCDHVSGDH